jgi:hypothetical protein
MRFYDETENPMSYSDEEYWDEPLPIPQNNWCTFTRIALPAVAFCGDITRVMDILYNSLASSSLEVIYFITAPAPDPEDWPKHCHVDINMQIERIMDRWKGLQDTRRAYVYNYETRALTSLVESTPSS